MTSRLLFLFLLAWAVAAVVALTRLGFDVLAADARGVRLPAQSFRSAVRTCVRCGVAFSLPAVFFTIFGTVEESWDVGFKPFSYDLTPYSGFVKRGVLCAVFGICFVMAMSLADRLLDKLLPNGPAVENTDDRRVANGK